MKEKIDTIYCDMDGVLVDFRAGCEEIGAIDGTFVDWQKVHEYGSDFWANLPWTKEGEHFYKWLNKYCKEQNIDLCILSQVNYEDGANGKMEWLMNNTRVPHKNIYIVGTNKSKTKFATNGSLLIDDYSKNVEAFIVAGGQAIKFNNPAQVRNELLML